MRTLTLVLASLLVAGCSASTGSALPRVPGTSMLTPNYRQSNSAVLRQVVIHNYWRVTPIGWKERAQVCYPFVDPNGQGGGSIPQNGHIVLRPNPSCNQSWMAIDTFSIPNESDTCTLDISTKPLAEQMHYYGIDHVSDCHFDFGKDGAVQYRYNMKPKYRPHPPITVDA